MGKTALERLAEVPQASEPEFRMSRDDKPLRLAKGVFDIARDDQSLGRMRGTVDVTWSPGLQLHCAGRVSDDIGSLWNDDNPVEIFRAGVRDEAAVLHHRAARWAPER